MVNEGEGCFSLLLVLTALVYYNQTIIYNSLPYAESVLSMMVFNE